MSSIKNNNKTTPQAPSRKYAFYAIGISLPIIFFVLLELVLRLSGFGRVFPLFIENPSNPSYILPRPNVVDRYFSYSAAKPSVTMEANFVLKDKPSNGYRIVVQGGSTAAGFPYGLGTSIAGTIEQRLRGSLPGKQVEVLNTAMSAVNTYTLIDLADEIIEQQPDAVFIYAGHNEYLGLLGVGSQYSFFASSTATRLFLALKEFRTFQLVQSVSSAISSAGAGGSEMPSAGSRTFMAQVAKNKNIVLGSSVYKQGLSQFESNLSILLEKYQDAGIPVFISTIASNEKDQAPFASSDREEKFNSLYELLFSSLKSLSQTLQRETIQNASQRVQHSKSASFHFEFATLALKQGLTGIAKRHFVLAKEHDLLRFRAPAEINTIIRALAKEHNAITVESEAEFVKRSPSGIIGNELMLEHLHPNLKGYFVISNEFYNALHTYISEANSVATRDDQKIKFQYIDIERAWRERLVLPQEEYFGFATIVKLKSDYPFTTTPKQIRLPKPADWQQKLGQDFFLNQIDWLSMIQRSLSEYIKENNAGMVAKTQQILADALPNNPLYNVQVAERKMKEKRYNEALHYFRRAKRAGLISNEVDGVIEELRNKLN